VALPSAVLRKLGGRVNGAPRDAGRDIHFMDNEEAKHGTHSEATQ
jgi:hypothetical protein